MERKESSQEQARRAGAARRQAHQMSDAAEQRLDQIVQAAGQLIAERGYSGLSLQAVADEVGITKAGVLHYVGSKEHLLALVIDRVYDRQNDGSEYLARFAPGGPQAGERPTIPGYFRTIVATNAARPQLVTLFQILNTEAIVPDSPVHDYFAARSRRVSDVTKADWSVPEGVDAEAVFVLSLAAIYGLESTWLLRQEDFDYEAEWARCEDLLFPLPLWEGYR